MNFTGFAITVLSVLLVASKSRQRALFGVMIGVLYLSQAEKFSIGGINFFAFRIIELAVFFRVMCRKEFSLSNLAKIDKAFIGFLVFTTVVYLLRTRVEIAYRLGVAVDAFLCYFAFRGLINTPDAFKQFLRLFLLLLVPFALLVLFESFTRHNLLSVVGGRTGGADLLRDGRLRACGSFRHPSLLGTLGQVSCRSI